MAWTNLLGQVRVGVRGSIATPVSQTLLLDTWSGAAAAYSLRKLSGTYSGSAIRVRRSSDNTEQNIGFNADGTLNTLALLAFVGSGNGFVTTWYDQSGNLRDAFQSSSANQPQIVSNGNITTLNNKPSLSFSGSSFMNTTQNVLSVGNGGYSVFGLGRPQSTPNCLFYIGTSTMNNGVGLNNNNGTPRHYWFANDYDSNQTFVNTNSIFVVSFDGVKRYTTINNVNTSSNSSGKNTTNPTLSIGRLPGYGQNLVGYESELIIYNLNKESLRTNITTDINSYYSIYATDTDAQSFINAASITDGTQIRAIDTLVTSLKSAGIWTKMKAIYPFVGGSATSHKFNLKDPRDLDAAYRLVFYGGMTHTNLGMVSNYTTSYADTRLTPSTTLSSLFSQHVSVYSQTSAATPANNINSIGEWQDGTRSMVMKIRNLSNVFSWEVGNSSASTTNIDGQGFYLGSVVANNSIKLYKNNTNVATNTNVFSGSLPSQVQPIGKNENKTFSFASIGDGLTDTEATSLYNAVQAYQTALGRAV